MTNRAYMLKYDIYSIINIDRVQKYLLFLLFFFSPRPGAAGSSTRAPPCAAPVAVPPSRAYSRPRAASSPAPPEPNGPRG